MGGYVKRRSLLWLLLAPLTLLWRRTPLGLTPYRCPFCGLRGRATDLQVTAPIGIRPIGGAEIWVVFRCPQGHLFTLEGE